MLFRPAFVIRSTLFNQVTASLCLVTNRSHSMKFIDIGANLTDPMYRGVYHGSQKHDPDLNHVLDRAWSGGLQKIIVTGGSLEESKRALDIAQTDDRLFCTVGCHPTRCLEFEGYKDGPEEYLQELCSLLTSNREKVVALGEFGLDYDRLQFCPKDTQIKYLERQLELLDKISIPLFIHCRNAAMDLAEILSKNKHRTTKSGVVHSFDGSLAEAQTFIDLGFYIGLNGCSLKTEENLQTVRELPLGSILLETDCPWCEVRPSHAGAKYLDGKFEMLPTVKKEKWQSKCMIKSRNEPCNIRNLLAIIAKVKDIEESEMAETIYRNTYALFFENL